MEWGRETVWQRQRTCKYNMPVAQILDTCGAMSALTFGNEIEKYESDNCTRNAGHVESAGGG